MALSIDPQGLEIKVLRSATEWRGRRVLEIGCGDGRLARRLVRLGALMVATDPNAEDIRHGQTTRPRTYQRKLVFAQGEGQRLPFKARSFDIMVFGWSL